MTHMYLYVTGEFPPDANFVHYNDLANDKQDKGKSILTDVYVIYNNKTIVLLRE
jgi:hypothetical protein